MDDARTEAQIIAALIAAELRHFSSKYPNSCVTANDGGEKTQSYGVNLTISFTDGDAQRMTTLLFLVPYLEPDKVRCSIIQGAAVRSEMWELRDPIQLGRLVKNLVNQYLPPKANT